VWAIVAELDVSAAEARYSSLGRHGYAPRHLLAVWVYASLVGMHYASVLARALKTDAALRLLAGGYEISPQTLRRFRQHSQPLFHAALEQTVRMAVTRGLLREDELAVDSMRLRAHVRPEVPWDGGRMKLKALVQKPENIARFLKHQGEPTEPPPLVPARSPPSWQARELRHRPQAQTEMFDA
jgi:transposase